MPPWDAICLTLTGFLLVCIIFRDRKGGSTPYVLIYLAAVITLVGLVVSSSRWLFRNCAGTAGRLYYSALGAMMLLVMLVVVPVFLSAGKQSGLPPLIVVSDAAEGATWMGTTTGARYGLCRTTWGRAQLSALDLSQAAGLAYASKCKDIAGNLSYVFPGRNAALVSCSMYHRGKRPDPQLAYESEYTFPRYIVIDFDDGDRRTRLFSIKGTSSWEDAAVDATLWSTVKVMQALQPLVPVASLLPMDQVQWFVKSFHIPSQLDTELKFWEDSTRRMRRWTRDGADHVITGHSLGGGIGQVLAARLGWEALFFSPMGVGYSAQRFGLHSFQDYATPHGSPFKDLSSRSPIGLEVAHHLVSVIQPQLDPVPMVDQQVGTVHHIECRAADDTEFSSNKDVPWEQYVANLFGVPCHSIQRSACELFRVCGDPQQRRIDCAPHATADDARDPRLWAVARQEALGAWYFPDDIQ